MRKIASIALLLTLFSGTLSINAQKTTKSKVEKSDNDKGLNLNYMDKTVRPQDDFYNYVNGGWMKISKIPSDRSRWGSFDQLREKTDQNSLIILHNIIGNTYPTGSEGQKIQALYNTFRDWNKRNSLGISPISKTLQSIDQINSLEDLQRFLELLTLSGNGNPFYRWYVRADMKNSIQNAVYLAGPKLGLGRDYYQKETESNKKVLAEYRKYIKSLLDIIDQPNSDEVSQKILDFEKAMGKTLLTLEQNRDANLRYNPQTMPQLNNLVKNVNLPNYLKAVGVNTNGVIIGELNYYKNLDSFINKDNLPFLKEYLKYSIIASNADNLDQKLDNLQFDFYGKYLNGQKEQRSIEKRGLSLINDELGEAFGKLYVEKFFPAKAKSEMVTLVGYIKKSFENRIRNLDWMSPATKEKALEKLNKFTVKIAYPDQWKDYSKLNLESVNEGGTYFANSQSIDKWEYQKALDKVGKPVDRTEWNMAPQTVNAYYNSSNNEIVFPAAILEPPFFNFNADPAVNFGGIGAVIGHEISHGFDDSGSKFDGNGNLNNWWTDEDRQKFNEATKKLGDQFDQYQVLDGIYVNGKFTMGENIGDLGGVNVAYDALQMYLNDHGNPGKINGFTQDQRFFMSWATVWRVLMTDQAKVNQVKTDPHSPGYFRAFGPLVNVDAFYNAFDIKPGDKLYKKPEDRVKIW